VARSSDEQASAELRFVEIDEIAIAFDPSARREVIAQVVHDSRLDFQPYRCKSDIPRRTFSSTYASGLRQ
jgi:hypothetical protein